MDHQLTGNSSRCYEKIAEKKKQHELIDIGSCSLHIIHDAFKIGAESSGWNIKAIFKGAFTILRDAPARARRADYSFVQHIGWKTQLLQAG